MLNGAMITKGVSMVMSAADNSRRCFKARAKRTCSGYSKKASTVADIKAPARGSSSRSKQVAEQAQGDDGERAPIERGVMIHGGQPNRIAALRRAPGTKGDFAP